MGDPDFPSPYINIGVAYLRLAVLADQCDDAEDALKNFRKAIEVSEACLERHPQRPQAHYHIGVAYCQIAVRLRGTNPHVFEDLRIRAGRSLKEARNSTLGQRRLPDSTEAAAGGQKRRRQPPWLRIDDEMVEAMSAEPDNVRLEPIK